ncbi:MAG: hypothetical protein KC668_27420 [Myxococcales bacterium]|nr:hypothetical protein [Myxococcales bacterium]
MLIPGLPSAPAPAWLLVCATALSGCGGTSSGNPSDQGASDGGRDLGHVDGGGQPDGGVTDPRFAHCPSSSAFVGESSWPIALSATEGAVYCTRFSEGRTLKEELAAKVQLRIVAGAYRLPTSAGPYPFVLPMCLAVADGPGPALSGADGSIAHSSSMYEQDTYHQLHVTQPLVGASFTADLYPTQRGAVLPTPTIDGSPYDPFGDSGFSFGFSLCLAASCEPGTEIYFDSCTHEDSSVHLHEVQLGDDGDVTFELRIGESAASTEPAAYVRATGTFRGTDFDQRDFFKLVYNPSHHHFERHFAVLFDAPIDGVCGIEVENLEPWDDYQPDAAYAVDCALDRLSTLTVESHTWTVE